LTRLVTAQRLEGRGIRDEHVAEFRPQLIQHPPSVSRRGQETRV
jgi:hypothetical protein